MIDKVIKGKDSIEIVNKDIEDMLATQVVKN